MTRLPFFCFLLTLCFIEFQPLWAVEVPKVSPLVPQIAEASEEPSETMGAMRVPEGWRLDLFAAEPDVANVVAMDVDRFGRLYVCETFRQTRGVTDNRAHDEAWLLADLASETVQDRIDYHKRLLGEGAITYAQHDDRLRRLVDTDGDGKVDQSTILANGFNGLEEGTGAGVLVHDNAIYYTCIPKLWKLTDADGNGEAESREALLDGFGVRVAFRGHDLHGLKIGMDGRLYFTIGDRGFHVTTPEGRLLSNPAEGAVFRCELDGTHLEVYADGLRNPQELAFNDYGDLFTVDNNSDSGDKARVVHLLQNGDSGWRMHYQYLADRGPFNRTRIWEPLHDEQPAHINPPIVNFTDGPSGLAYYPGTGFGDRLNDQFLICDFRGGPSNSGIRSFKLNPSGATYEFGDNEELIWTVLATDVQFGPSGGLFVSDWVDGWDGLGKARVYRLTDPEAQDSDLVAEVTEVLASDFEAKSKEQLSDLVKHVDRRVRLHAQWELGKRGDGETLSGLAVDVDLDPRFRLHGMWGLQHAARLNASLVPMAAKIAEELMSDADAFVRAGACQLIAELDATARRSSEDERVAMKLNVETYVAKLVKTIDDDSDRVRYFATMALTTLLEPHTGEPQSMEQLRASVFEQVIQLLAKNENKDAVLRHAGTEFLRRAVSTESVIGLHDHPSVDVRRSAVAALRSRLNEGIATFLSDDNPLVASEASMAIHDEPIPAAEQQLASLLDSESLPIDQDPLLFRAISTNFRIGSQSSADSVANFAASAESPEWARIEALDALEDWGNPDPRCRVTNEYRPITARDDSAKVFAAEALGRRIEEILIAGGAVREKAIDVASRLGIQKIAPQLIERIGNADASPATRAGSLMALSRLNLDKAKAMAAAITPRHPVQLMVASLDVLGKSPNADALERFLTATQSDKPPVRGLAWDLLAKIDGSRVEKAIQKGIDQYVDGKLPADVHLNVLEAAQRRLSAESLDVVVAAQTKLAESEPLAKWLPSLHGGDVEQGKKLFFEKTELSCVRCHVVGRAGGEVGPVLTTVGKKYDRKTLLEAICLPSAKIAEGYETAVIANEDGQVFTGIVASEDDDFVELIAADGSRNRIDQEEIMARKRGTSSMPAGLPDLMTPRELRNLVAYLASLQVDPRAAADTE